MELCGVDTVLSGAVSGGLCDLDRASGGGDTDMGSVDTVVSDAVSGCVCDIDSVSRVRHPLLLLSLFLSRPSCACW